MIRPRILVAATAVAAALSLVATAAPSSGVAVGSVTLDGTVRSDRVAARPAPTTIVGFAVPTVLGRSTVLRRTVAVSGRPGRPVRLQVLRGRAWVTVATVRTVRSAALGANVARFAVPVSRMVAASRPPRRAGLPSTIVTINGVRMTVAADGSLSAAATTPSARTRVTPTAPKTLGLVPQFITGSVTLDNAARNGAPLQPWVKVTGDVTFVATGATRTVGRQRLATYRLWRADLTWKALSWRLGDCVLEGSGRLGPGQLTAVPAENLVEPLPNVGSKAAYRLSFRLAATARPAIWISCPDGRVPTSILNVATLLTTVCQRGVAVPATVTRPRSGNWDMAGGIPRTGSPCSPPETAQETNGRQWDFVGVEPIPIT